MDTERRANDIHGIWIGQVRADGEVYSHTGVHIGRVDEHGNIHNHLGVHIGTAHPMR
jgi:hypothetical protein